MLSARPETTAFADLLTQASSYGTGCLHVSGEDRGGRVYLADGKVYAVHVDGYTPRVGQRLLLAGAIGENGYSDVTVGLDGNPLDPRFGQVCLRRGLINESMLHAIHRELLLSALGAMTTWGPVRAKWRDGATTDEFTVPAVSVAGALGAVHKRATAWDAMWAEVASGADVPDSVPVRVSGTSTPSDLTREQQAVLGALDGQRIVDEVAGECGLTRFETGFVLSGLVDRGLVRFEQPDVPVEYFPDPRVVSVPEPVISAPDPLVSIPEPVVSIPAPVVSAPAPAPSVPPSPIADPVAPDHSVKPSTIELSQPNACDATSEPTADADVEAAVTTSDTPESALPPLPLAATPSQSLGQTNLADLASFFATPAASLPAIPEPSRPEGEHRTEPDSAGTTGETANAADSAPVREVQLPEDAAAPITAPTVPEPPAALAATTEIAAAQAEGDRRHAESAQQHAALLAERDELTAKIATLRAQADAAQAQVLRAQDIHAQSEQRQITTSQAARDANAEATRQREAAAAAATGLDEATAELARAEAAEAAALAALMTARAATDSAHKAMLDQSAAHVSATTNLRHAQDRAEASTLDSRSAARQATDATVKLRQAQAEAQYYEAVLAETVDRAAALANELAQERELDGRTDA